MVFRINTMFAMLFITTIAAVQASSISFEASPSELKSNLTEALSMRCSITGNTARATSTDVDVHQVVSIYVTYKDGQDVASVTSVDPPVTYIDQGNLDVKGSISGTSGEGFLELSWRDPSKVSLGNYTCAVAAIDARGHIVQLTSGLRLTAVAPSITDVLAKFSSKLQDQQQAIDSQSHMIESLQHDVLNQTQVNDLQEQRILNLTQVNDLQEQHILDLSKETAKLKACVSPRIAFTVAKKGTGNILAASSGHTVMFDQVILNEGGNFDISTGSLTCTTEGMYVFNIHALGTNDSMYAVLALQHNGVTVTTAYVQGASHGAASTGATLHLKVGDVVKVVSAVRPSLIYQDNTAFQTNIFAGHLVQADTCLM